MRSTTNYALPYPESPDHTRTWEYWQGLAEAVDALLNGARFNKPCIFAGHPANTVIGANNTVIVCDQVTVNKGGWTSSAAGVTVPVKGIYALRFRVLGAHTAAGQCQLWVKTAAGAGLAYGADSISSATNETVEAAAPAVNLNAGDVIKPYVTYAGTVYPLDTNTTTIGTELTLAMLCPT